jgi:uncharacterized protein with HEPN domain
MSKDHLERSPRLYLSEIIFYIEKIEKFTKDLTKEEFLKDEALHQQFLHFRSRRLLSCIHFASLF